MNKAVQSATTCAKYSASFSVLGYSGTVRCAAPLCSENSKKAKVIVVVEIMIHRI
jgi:hypothetical protein